MFMFITMLGSERLVEGIYFQISFRINLAKQLIRPYGDYLSGLMRAQ